MSSLWINIRAGRWFLQIGPDRPFVEIKRALPDAVYGDFFAIYEFFGLAK